MSGLGVLIKAKRKVEGLSLREFSKKCNLSHTYIKNLEDFLPGSGQEVTPTIDSIDKIPRALDMSLEEILKETGYIKDHYWRFEPANLKLIRGNKTFQEITDDIYTKTGHQIDSYIYEDLENGNDENPSPFIIDLLAKYSGVAHSFFYKKNSPADLEDARKNVPYHYYGEEKDVLSHIKDNRLKEFITEPANLEYLKLAKELNEKKIPVETVKNFLKLITELR